MLAGFKSELEKIRSSVGSRNEAQWEQHEKDLEAARRTAEKIRQSVANRFNVSPFLTGSLATGLNKPGDFDYDYGIRVTSKPKFDRLVEQMGNVLESSPYNKPGTDYHVFKTSVHGQDVDIAVMYGDKGKTQRDALAKAVSSLTDEQRQAIVKKKVDLEGAWFFKDRRYKAFKRDVDQQLGLPKFKRDKVAAVADDNHISRLGRADVFGHRTHNLEPILESQALLSAVDLARQGKLKSYETAGLVRGRSNELPEKLRSEVFITKGLLPSTSSYGRYGIMFQKRDAEPSRYINTIPEEYTTNKVTSKMTFVVPDQEINQWSERFPHHTFVEESRVPEGKRLEARDLLTPFRRLAQGAKFTQKKENM